MLQLKMASFLPILTITGMKAQVASLSFRSSLICSLDESWFIVWLLCRFLIFISAALLLSILWTIWCHFTEMVPIWRVNCNPSVFVCKCWAEPMQTWNKHTALQIKWNTINVQTVLGGFSLLAPPWGRRVVLGEVSQHLLNGLLWNLILTFMSP